MLLKRLKVHTSPDVLQQIEIEDDFKIQYLDQTFRVHRETHDVDQHNAVTFAILPTLLQTALIYGLIISKQVALIPVTGDRSLASYILIIALMGSFIIFSTAFYLGIHKQLPYAESLPIRHYPALMVAILIIVMVTCMFFFYLFDKLFYGLRLDPYLSSLFAAILFTVINYFVLYFLFSFNSYRLTHLLIQLMVGGVIISMITNSESSWWKRHLSMLGSSKVENSWQFNLTLILSGLLMIALVDSIFVTLQKQFKNHRGLKVLRYSLYLLGFSLSMVGLFPIDGPSLLPFFHNRFAELLVVLTIFMMVFNHLLIPQVTKTFRRASYGVASILVSFTAIFQLGDYVTLTAFEIISFMIAFTWLILLFDFLNHIMHPQSLTLTLDIDTHSHPS